MNAPCSSENLVNRLWNAYLTHNLYRVVMTPLKKACRKWLCHSMIWLSRPHGARVAQSVEGLGNGLPPEFDSRQGHWWDFFSWPPRSDRLWGPSCLPSNGYFHLVQRLRKRGARTPFTQYALSYAQGLYLGPLSDWSQRLRIFVSRPEEIRTGNQKSDKVWPSVN
jgi:hypothetical protein